MRRILFVVAYLFLTSFSAFAQVTQKQLLGKWHMCGISEGKRTVNDTEDSVWYFKYQLDQIRKPGISLHKEDSLKVITGCREIQEEMRKMTLIFSANGSMDMVLPAKGNYTQVGPPDHASYILDKTGKYLIIAGDTTYCKIEGKYLKITPFTAGGERKRTIIYKR